MHFDGNSLIAAGVFAHLLLALGKQLFTKPRQQAQIAALAAKTAAVLGEVQAVAALLPPAPPSDTTQKGQ